MTSSTLTRSLAGAAFLAVAIAFAGPAEAQEPPPHVVVLQGEGLEQFGPAVQAFVSALREAGVAARTEEHHLAAGEPSPAAARALKESSLVLAIGTKAAQVAKRSTRAPVIFCAVANPVESGLVASFESSGGNIAGVVLDPDPKDVFASLKELLPSVGKIGVLYDPKKSATAVERARRAASELKIELVTRAVDDAEKLPDALGELGAVDAIWTPIDGTVVNGRTARFLIHTSMRKRVPLIGFSEAMVRAGAMLGFSSDIAESGRQAAEIAKRVLKGDIRAPALPVAYPRRPLLMVNEIVAERMGLKPDASAVKKATLVVRD